MNLQCLSMSVRESCWHSPIGDLGCAQALRFKSVQEAVLYVESGQNQSV